LLFVVILKVPVIYYGVSKRQCVLSDISLLGLDFLGCTAPPQTRQLADRLSKFRASITVAAKYNEQRGVQSLISHYISI